MSALTSSYFTHDNGGRPFLVRINREDKTIQVSKSSASDNVEHYDDLVLTINDYEEVFVGFDIETSNHGHAILVKISPHEYIHIGSEIYKFETKDEIYEYVAPIGNSDVVYDYAVGYKNMYLLAEKKFYDKKFYDPYSLHYGHKPNSKKMKIKMIHKRIW